MPMTHRQWKNYLQRWAQSCKQYADEGECLARVARFAPVTIAPQTGPIGMSSLHPNATMGQEDVVVMPAASPGMPTWAKWVLGLGAAYGAYTLVKKKKRR